jgi:serine/threonine-protein kinase HSL1 (negative regulator of Swe1 kinase)
LVTVLKDSVKFSSELDLSKMERGAASSFNKVVETVQSTLARRGMVVEDPSRAKTLLKDEAAPRSCLKRTKLRLAW